MINTGPIAEQSRLPFVASLDQGPEFESWPELYSKYAFIKGDGELSINRIVA